MEQVQRKAFPPRHALVNPIAQNAFAMRFLKEEKLSNIGPNSSINSRVGGDIMNAAVKEGSENLLKILTFSAICDAMLVRRPYARIIEGDPGLTGILRFKIDGELVSEGAIRKFLVKDMQDPALDDPFEWSPTQCLFLSGRLENRQGDVALERKTAEEFRHNLQVIGLPTGEKTDPADEPPGHEVAILDKPASIFVPNGSWLEISAMDIRIPDGKPVLIEAGFLAATYTSKDAARPRRILV